MQPSNDHMNSKQRFHETMAYGFPDHAPYFKEGIRDDVIEQWRKQGLGMNQEVDDLFQYDEREEIWLNLEPIPHISHWPQKKSDLKWFISHLDPMDPTRLPESWEVLKKKTGENSPIIILRAHRGFFLSMGVYQWDRFLEVMYLLQDDPVFVKKLLSSYGEFCAAIAERVLSEINVDAVLFSEPIGGNDRPLLSPEMYEEFMFHSYKAVFAVLDKHNIKTRIFRTYANTRVLLPTIVDWGFNCLWACEVNLSQMDYRNIRNEFGTDLRLIGGIDLDALRKDKKTIYNELTQKVPPLLKSGGYIPLADGRVRSDIPFQNYVYYRKVLEQIMG